MLVVYLARHGETEWNAAGRIQGHTDTPLNEAGRDQARGIAEKLQKKNVGAVAASDLTRARETAEIVAKGLRLAKPSIDTGLRERQLGAFEGLTREELRERFPVEWDAYKRDHANTPPGGEPWDSFFERITGCVRGLATRLARKDRPALIVTHGGVLKALVLASLETPALVTVPNGALYRFAVEKTRLRLAPE
jgi:probable phosphoglycerate mutase